MAATVLGKRTRGTATATYPETRTLSPDERRVGQSAKRRRNASNIVVHEDEDGHHAVEQMQIDDASNVTNTEPATTRARPALSPRKSNEYRTLPSCDTVALDNDGFGLASTPKTPRHRDALSKRVPVTPRHHTVSACVPGTPRTPQTSRTPLHTAGPIRQLFNEARKVFARGASPNKLIGREEEREELRSFITETIIGGTGGCLYVSGPPGTGKSAFVGHVCSQIDAQHTSLTHAYLNCMSVKTATDVYTQLASELHISDDVFGSGAKEAVTKMFGSKSPTTYLVVLDEIDHLLTMDLSILYGLFEQALHNSSKLILIGIANALDLTDRFLPRLKARNLKPQLLPFLPYTSNQIAKVLMTRARSLLPANNSMSADFTPFLMMPGITLIAKKVAAQTGDLRKAFDMASKALDIVEAETREKYARIQQAQTQQVSPSKTPLGENPNLSSPLPSPDSTPTKRNPAAVLPETMTVENAPRATLAHVVRVASAAFGNGTAQRLKALNLQQKAILCALAALEQRNARVSRDGAMDAAHSAMMITPTSTPSKRARGVASTPRKNGITLMAPTVRDVFEAYSALCTRENVLHALSWSEFGDVLGNLETCSLVQAVGSVGKGGSFAVPSTPSKRGRGSVFGANGKVEEKRIAALAGADELEKSLDGVVGGDTLRRILEGRDL